MKLEEGRKLIDELDSQIVTLLNRRARLSRKIGETKSRAGLPVVDQTREELVLRRVVGNSSGEIDDHVLKRIYREILSESRRIQKTVVVQLSPAAEVRK